ncbi:autotransporter domain-containing protein [Methylobacillus caricis]|uniref:autotransporter domain-containing protein n=1 Tax=Methylobacillus caricis TaxID=1971611 RepID=UPI001CFFC3B5|nr:autotransporter domain-containing protein [Methylobacillus caricis]MCB5187571.1 autotransporter domain-containing protein [Methylobacillus caricis]
MNRAYKTIWSAVRQMYQVVPESARGSSRSALNIKVLVALAGVAMMSEDVLAESIVYTPYAVDMNPASWVKDRGGSPGLQLVEWQGRDALKLEINPPAMPDSFNNWQGYSQRTLVPAGASFLRGDLWIEADWQSGTATDYINTGLWGSAMPESVVVEDNYINSEAAFPIIHFNNQDGSGHLQVWDDGSWIDLAETAGLVKYDGWNSMDMRLLPEQNKVEYYFNGALVYSWNPPATASGEPSQFWAMYLKARNNGETVFDSYWSRLLAGKIHTNGEVIGDITGDLMIEAGATAKVQAGATISGSLLAEGVDGRAAADFAGSVTITGSLIGSNATYTFTDPDQLAVIHGNVELENGSTAVGGTKARPILVGGNIRLAEASLGGSWQVTNGFLEAVDNAAALLIDSQFSGTVNGIAGAVVKSDASSIVMHGGSVTNAGTGNAVTAISEGTYDGEGVELHALGNGGAGIVANTGGQANLNDSEIFTQGQAGHGIVSDGVGSLAKATGSSITVAGSKAYGVHASNGGQVVLESVLVNQTNTDAYGRGLNATGTGSGITVGNTVINVNGTGTNGSDAAVGVAASQGARITLDGGDILMTGEDRTYGIRSDQGGNVTTNGTNISTEGVNSHGLLAWAATSGSFASLETTINIHGGTVTTAGQNSYGLFAQNQGALVHASEVQVITSGGIGRGLYAYNGGMLDIADGLIRTSGNDAVAVQASGAQSLINTSDLTVETTGERAFGISAGWFDGIGGKVVFEQGSISTFGQDAHGASAMLDGEVQLHNSMLIVHGENAAAAFSTAGGQLEITSSSITSQQGAGIYLLNNAGVILSDTDVNAHGASILSDLTEAGQIQNILIGTGTSLTRNNGVLLQVNRNEDGMDGTINLTLASGSVSRGDVVDLDGLESGRSGQTNLTIGTGAQWIGVVRGLNDLIASDGAILIDTDGGHIDGNISGGEAATIAFINGADIGGGVIAGTGSMVRFDGFTSIAETVASQGASFVFGGETSIGSNVSAESHAQLEFNGVTTTVGGGVSASQGTTLLFNSSSTNIIGDVNLSSQSILNITGDATIGGAVNANGSSLSFTGATRLDNGLTATNSLILFSRSEATNILGDVSLGQGAITHGGTIATPILVDGNAVVSDSALLGGNFIFSGVLSGNGTIGPGNSVGTQAYGSVAGFSGTYVAEVNLSGQSDLVHITDTGVSNLGGINLEVTQENGNGGYLLNHRYTILTTDGSLGTPFGSSAWTGGGLVGLDTIYNADSVEVSLFIDQDAVSSVQSSLTRNQRAVLGGALLAAGSNRIIDAALQHQDSAAALDQLSGEIHASVRNLMTEDSRFVRNAAIDRVRQAFGSVAAADNGSTVENERYTTWTQAIGQWGHDDGNRDAASISRRVGGLLFGADAKIGEYWRAGALAGYANGSYDADGRHSSASVRSYHIGAYGGTEWNNVGLRLGVAHSWHDIDTRRNVVFPGLAVNSKAGYEGRSAQVFAEMGYRVDAGRLSLEPFASLAYVNLHTDGFHEKEGAGLHGISQRSDTTFTTLGLRGAHYLGKSDTSTAILRGSLGWRRASGDIDGRTQLAFNGGESFGIAGVPIRRDALMLDAGLDISMSGSLSLTFSYLGQLARHSDDHGLRASLSWQF